MLCQGDGRAVERVLIMAIFAAVHMRSPGELALVNVLVAVEAEVKLDHVLRRLACGRMALIAFHFHVLPAQGEGNRHVLRSGELRGLEPSQCVARFARASVLALRELAAVRVRIVAVRADFEDDGALEVGAVVASFAGHLYVLTFQWILRRGVIELDESRSTLPADCLMTRLTGVLERAVMHIRVTVGAAIKLQSDIAYRAVDGRHVTLLAGDIRMSAGQRVLSLRVIEVLAILPCVLIVAAGTVIS